MSRVTLSGDLAPDPGAPAPNMAAKPGSNQHSDYWVLSQDELDKGFVRPYRDAYVHTKCGTVTRMHSKLAATYARDPTFYGATFCCACNDHLPVAEFTWDRDGKVVGS